MKNGMRFLLLGFTLLVMSGCGGDDKKEDAGGGGGTEKPGVTSSYMLAKWNNSADIAGKVYLQLNDDKTFSLYQNVNNYGFEKLEGSYKITGQLLSGVYANSDGSTTTWATSYVVESMTSGKMVLIATDGGVVSEYTGVEIPAYVKDGATLPVRAQLEAQVPFL